MGKTQKSISILFFFLNTLKKYLIYYSLNEVWTKIVLYVYLRYMRL